MSPELVRAGGPAFYTLVGRPDLLEKYEARHDGKYALRVAGAFGVVAGFLWWGVASVTDDSLLASCRTSPDPVCSKVHWGPDLMMLGGLAAIVAPFFIDDNPLTQQERSDLVAQRAAWPRVTNLSLAPRLEQDGASLAVMGRF